MSWSVSLIGHNKEKLKAAIREQQVKDEKQPHNGIPVRVADFICSEIDRVRVYEYAGKRYGLNIVGSGSFHEQGISESLKIDPVQIVE